MRDQLNTEKAVKPVKCTNTYQVLEQGESGGDIYLALSHFMVYSDLK